MNSTSVSAARMLLDPRAAKHFSENKKDASSNGLSRNESPSAHSEADASPASHGLGNHIERLHGVRASSERPAKKQKVDSDEEALTSKKPTSIPSKGGDLGEYLKKRREEAAADTNASNNVVDLTSGEEVEDVVCLSEHAVEVCYGRLDNAKVHAHQVPWPSGKSIFQGHTWPIMKLKLQRMPGRNNIIRVLDPTERDFGNVDVRTSAGLASIMDAKAFKIRTQAKLLPRSRKFREVPGADCSEYFAVAINLYGPKHKAETVGKWLSQKQIWLRQPFTSDANIQIYNPHDPQEIKAKIRLSEYTGSRRYIPSSVSRTVEEIRSEVTDMFDSLQGRSEILEEQEADERVTTPLLPHQKQGLYFLNYREGLRSSGEQDQDERSLWRIHDTDNGKKTYYNVITGQEEKERPADARGGILADMMGLGKTLSILALVVGSLPEAAGFEAEPLPQADGSIDLVRNSKTTLLVAPLSTMANWEDQIRQHLKKDSLSCYIYHGPNRTTKINELAKYDMVITSYSTVSSEAGGRSRKKQVLSPLFQANFFRIVLDEAHMIREQSTKQSQAICELSAQRRWAVTGTPVQNRLDDLGALIKFLRVRPFSDRGGFAQYILSPFKNADPEILPKLRLLVHSLTLRRLKDRIDLPTKYDSIVELDFNEEERRLYDWFEKDSKAKLRIIAHDQLKSLGGRSYAHILRAIIRLRLICAHGRELLSEDDLKITEGLSKENAIDLEDENLAEAPSLTPRQAYEMLMLAQETNTNTCISCTKAVQPREGDDAVEEEVIGCMLPCYQLLCPDCTDSTKAAALSAALPGNTFKCPFCQAIVKSSFFELTKEGMEDAEEVRAAARRNPRQAKILGRYSEPHTKVQTLIKYLKESEEESKSLAKNEQPIKSVVFSGWTSYLDLIQIALEVRDIEHVRLDGKMSRRARNQALDSFRDDPKVRVILISITAGGLGLNLTAGSRVFVMEPQFNPAVEAQAIDRVHRLGQKREVFAYRFIMKDSFEVKMRELQRKKQALADLSMNRGKLDKAEAAKKKLDELRSLFR